jgi:hypothetical protein
MREIGAFEAKTSSVSCSIWWSAARRSSSPDTARRWRCLVPPLKAVNREQARAAVNRIRERAGKLKLGPFEWAE